MVREEIQDESQIAEDAVEYRSLRRNLMLCQLVADARDEGDLLAEAEHFSRHGHAALELVEAVDEFVKVGTARFQVG